MFAHAWQSVVLKANPDRLDKDGEVCLAIIPQGESHPKSSGTDADDG